jgi:cytochrome b561
MMAAWTGWIATAMMVAAALVQVVYRLRHGKRPDLGSRVVTFHFVMGLCAAGAGFIHPLTALLDLGSPEAIGGGVIGLGFGGLAFVVLLAHTGLGLRLRDPRFRKRAKARRAHVITAMTILVAVTVHVVACWTGVE